MSRNTVKGVTGIYADDILRFFWSQTIRIGIKYLPQASFDFFLPYAQGYYTRI